MRKNYKIKNTNVSKYWNDNAKELSDKIWLPTQEEMKEKESILEGSWFNGTTVTKKQKKSAQIKFPRQKYEEINDPVSKNPFKKKEHTPIKAKTIPLYFDNRQEGIVKKWFDDARLYYNTAVNHLNANSDELITFENLRTKINDLLKAKYPSVENTPRDIRDESVRDAHIAVIQAKKSYIKNKIFCHVSFRAKKDKEQALYIPKKVVKENKFYSSYLGNLHTRKGIVNKFNGANCACKLTRNKLGYFIVIPVEYSAATKNFNKTIAVDPGVRTFLTGYSQNEIIEIGTGCISKINKIRRKIENIQSDMTKVCAKERYRMKKVQERLRTKIQNLVKDCHWKVGDFLTTNFSTILIPAFNVKDIINKKNRRLRKITVKNLIDWCHYLFRLRLLHQAKKNNCSVVITNESYTSKTCSVCGHIHQKLGGNKVFKCPNCDIIIGRDVNGARGIFIRSLISE